MKDNEFFLKYGNTPIANRFNLLSNEQGNLLLGMTLNDVYQEITAIDDKIRADLIRKEQLLSAVAAFWEK